MIRPLLLAAALLAPAAASAQALPPASRAPRAVAPPSVGGDAAGPGRYGRMTMSPELRQARQAMMQACAADFARFCADVPAAGQGGGQAGGGGRMQCLRQHASEMSDGCRSSMQAWRAARQGAASPAAPPPSVSPQG